MKKRYSLSDDKVVNNLDLSVKEKAKILGRSTTSIIARKTYLNRKIKYASPNTLGISKLAVKKNYTKKTDNPISFTMNGININISGVSKLDINGNKISINS